MSAQRICLQLMAGQLKRLLLLSVPYAGISAARTQQIIITDALEVMSRDRLGAFTGELPTRKRPKPPQSEVRPPLLML